MSHSINDVIFRSCYTDDEYRQVINYLKQKCPEMVKTKHKIQWRYAIPSNRKSVTGTVEGIQVNSDMSAIIAFDKNTLEPVGFAGLNFLKHSTLGITSRTICVYVDPEYRRLGISELMHVIHEEKCRQLGIKHTDEVQINKSIYLSKKLGYEQITKGRLCNDGTYSQVKFRIHNFSEESIDRYDRIKDFDYVKGWGESIPKDYIINNNLNPDDLLAPWSE